MQAGDGKYYLAQEEYHECIPVKDKSANKLPIKTDNVIGTLDDLTASNFDLASYTDCTQNRVISQESMEDVHYEDDYDGLEASAY